MAIDPSDAKLSAQAKAATPKKSTTVASGAAYQEAQSYKTPTATPAAPLALPSSFTPYLTLGLSTTTSSNGMFIGPIPTGSTRTATGYTTAAGTPVNPAGTTTSAGGNTGGGTGGGGGGATNATTARAVFESRLRELGIPSDLIQSSVSYLEALDEAGVKDAAEQFDIYMNNKTFTTKTGNVLNSPFYAKYTALTEGVKNPTTGKPYTGKEAFAWRLGIEEKTQQYGFSSLFTSDDSLRKLAQNNVSVANWETRMQKAQLADINADPAKVAALRKLGFVSATGGVKDFYLNKEIGQKQMEENQRIGAFATEAVRFAGKGINFDEARIRQISAMYGMQTEEGAADIANKLYAGVGENLQQTVALAGMYDKTGKKASEELPGIQTELENEILSAVPADRRKRLAETNEKAFQGRSGLAQGALGVTYTAGLI